MKKKTLSWIKIILVNVFILLFLLKIIDPFVKTDFAYIPETKRSIVLREIHPNLNIQFKNRQQISSNPKAELKTIFVKTDKDGFLRNKIDFNENDSTDIIFFGGSTTASLYVDEKLRWTHLVEKNLSEIKGREVTVLNSSNSGNHSFHSNLSLISKGLEKNPKVCVLMNVINDIGLLTKTNSYFATPISRSIINNKELTINESNDYNELIYFFKTSLRGIFPNIYGIIRDRILGYNSINFKQDEFSDYRNQEINKNEVLNQYDKSINLFIDICLRYSITPIIMTQFNLINLENFDNVLMGYKKDYLNENQIKDFMDVYIESNNLLRKISKERNIRLIDLDSMIPKKDSLFVDVIHLNNKGSILVSEIITNQLQELIQ